MATTWTTRKIVPTVDALAIAGPPWPFDGSKDVISVAMMGDSIADGN
jgi:hypothetical protein